MRTCSLIIMSLLLSACFNNKSDFGPEYRNAKEMKFAKIDGVNPDDGKKFSIPKISRENPAYIEEALPPDF